MSLVGRLEDLALSDIFQILSIGKKTGTLMIRSDKGNAFIVFKNGLIVRAETSTLEGNIGRDLLKKTLVKEHVYKMAQEVKKKLPSKSVAEILFELDSASRDQLDKFARKRIEKVIYHLLLMSQGDFHFELDNLDVGSMTEVGDTGWEVSRGISPEYLLMEGARVHDEMSQKENLEEGLTEGEGGEAWEEDWGEHPVAVERKDISALKSLTQELRFPNSTSEITLLILRFASDIFQRGVLFMVGEDELTGLGQFGLEIERADERIRETVLSYGESHFLKGIIENAQSYKGSLEKDVVTESLIRELGGGWPLEVIFFPVITEAKVVALLYCDNAHTGDPFSETEGLDIFISQAGLALEKSLLQRRLQEMQKAGGKTPKKKD
ncbi:MAG: DUF4388 domain-containing protein [Nitrospirae bacterium]|nr:DUF4388 domain-containing protein [Nitrospirota bacterium]MCL5422881.1 DUF4388 domain-containing protein [Nitrospirota bacterium]